MSTRVDHHSLLERREHLLRSIEDLDREHAAGDLDDAGYAELRGRYVAEAAAVLRALDDASDLDERATVDHDVSRVRRVRRYLGRRGVRRFLVVGSVICVLAVIALSAAEVAGVRLPGEDETGTISVPSQTELSQQLARAATLASGGDLNDAIELYDSILAEVPKQPVAFTYRAWLERLAGRAHNDAKVVGEADEQLATAAKVFVTYPDAQGLYGIALLEDTNSTAAALTQFLTFLNDHPSVDLLTARGPEMAEAFEAAHRPVPKGLQRYESSSAAGTVSPPS